MNHYAGPLHILLVEKEGRIWFSIICLKLYQFERSTWWCLSILEFVLQFVLQYVLKFVLLEKILKKITVSRNLHQAHLLEVGPTKIRGDHETLFIIHHVRRTPCRLFIHEVFLGP